ncbi:MAG: hypothetical protein WCC01_11475 [Acidimicrobiia bacterium]
MSLTLAFAIDDLYRDVVMDPDRWGDEAYAEWLENAAIDVQSIDKVTARSLRRAVRIAGKLQKFWSSPDAARYQGEPSWETRVDIAVGIPAWRPGLELAERDFEESPSQDAFDEVRRRFRIVNGSTWMEGVDYETWVDVGTNSQNR